MRKLKTTKYRKPIVKAPKKPAVKVYVNQMRFVTNETKPAFQQKGKSVGRKKVETNVKPQFNQSRARKNSDSNNKKT